MVHNLHMLDLIVSNFLDGQMTSSEKKAGAKLMFDVADATWRTEAAKVLPQGHDDPDLHRLPEARGEPGTLLRTSYEVRERAYAELRRFLKSNAQ